MADATLQYETTDPMDRSTVLWVDNARVRKEIADMPKAREDRIRQIVREEVDSALTELGRALLDAQMHGHKRKA